MDGKTELIGGVEKRRIEIVDYDPQSTVKFQTHRRAISEALGDATLRVEHIGSTAVPGLAAKPIIDVLLVVQDSGDEDSYLPKIEAAGYELRVREPHFHEHRMFRTPARDVHVHVYSRGSSEIERYLTFRNWLKTAPEMRVEITTPVTSYPLHFAVSPDGGRLVFVAAGDGPSRLWGALDSEAAQPLAGSDNAEYPFWSPDSRSIGFFSSGKLQRIDIAGGRPQPLANAPANRGGAWNSDGTIVFAASQIGPLSRVSASGGEPEVVTRIVQGHLSHRFPQFLPDGRHFLFFVQGSVAHAGNLLELARWRRTPPLGGE
jgi:GrpB-like predicted nucleotidyltransferase (UPF0157 family)